MDCIKQRDKGTGGGLGRGWPRWPPLWGGCRPGRAPGEQWLAWTGQKGRLSSPANFSTRIDLQITLIFLEEEEERKGWLDFEESKGMDPAGLDKLSFFLSFFPRSFSRYCLLVKEQRGERSVCNWGNRVRWAVRYEEIDAIVWILCGEWYIYIYIVCVLSLFEGEGRNWWYYRCFSWNS